MKKTKKLGFLTVIITIVGSAIGSGIFFKNASILNNTQGDVKFVIACWIIASIGVIALGLALMEVISVQDGDKGILGWVQIFTSKIIFYWSKGYILLIFYPITIIGISIYSVKSLQDIMSWNLNWKTVILISFAIISLVKIICFFNLNFASKLQWLFTLIAFIPIVLIPIYGFINLDKNIIKPMSSVTTGLTGQNKYFGVILSIPAIFFAFDGFYNATALKKEMKNPKHLPMAIVIGLSIITCVYLFMASGILTGSKYGTFNVLNKPLFKSLMNSFIFLAVLSTLIGYSMGTYKIYDEFIAEDKFIFSKFLKKWKTKDFKITKNIILRGLTPGICILFVLIFVYLTIISFVGVFGYSDNNGFSNTYSHINYKLGSLYSFIDLITTWIALLVFIVITFAIIGALVNKFTKKIKVVKFKLFIPSAIISIILILSPILYIIIEILVNITGFNGEKSQLWIIQLCTLIIITTIPFMFIATEYVMKKIFNVVKS